MSEEQQVSEELLENADAKKVVLPEGPLKQLFVNYVGEKLKPEDGNVTVEMIVHVMADEFPEFLMVLAEENFLRGYQQALNDVEQFNKNIKDTQEEAEKVD
jgi:hypothetical protein